MNTQTKPHETLDFRLNLPKGTFSLRPPIDSGSEGGSKRSWIIGLTSLAVYNSIFCNRKL